MSISIPLVNYRVAPTAQHVEVKIKGANWWPTDEDQIAAARSVATLAVRASVQRFLRIVRWEPFICSGQDETRYYNRIDEQGRIMLGEGLLSLTSITIQGRAYTLNDTVSMEPSNAGAKNKPYTHLLLWPNNYGFVADGIYRNPRELKPRSIVITGQWGYTMNWPEDAFEAIVSRAAAITLSSVNQEQELSSISQDGFSEQYDLVGPVDQKRALDEWGKYFEVVAASYAKPKLGPDTYSTSAHTAHLSRNHLPLA